MSNRVLCAAFFAGVLATVGVWAESRTVWLDELDLRPIHQGWGSPQARKSVQKKPIALAGTTYERGVGSHARGTVHIALDGQTRRFAAIVGVDDETNGQGTVTLKIYGDGNVVFATEILRGGQAPAEIDLDVSGLRHLILVMGDGGDNVNYDHVDWADARFEVDGADPALVKAPDEEKVVLTPKPPREPQINGPRVYAVRPGSPFLFRIPATGDRPMRFSVRDLPDGLSVHADTGIVTGTIADRTPASYDTTLIAENAAGKAERGFRIVVGETLALTPPMGWNHWYAHYDRVTDAIMREAADVMVSSGMADVGYQYVNIDDCWMNAPKHGDPKRVGPLRDANDDLIPNSYFPDMRALTDYIHAKGLKAGIYISPGPRTCAGFAGSYQHEERDAKKFAEWGFDFLKYDWCSYGNIAADQSLAELEKPYRKMSEILRRQNRDIVFNLCQYGMGDVWTWGEEVGGHCWRTAGDLGFELRDYQAVARRNAGYRDYAHPGSWNDPDYLLLGYAGPSEPGGQGAAFPITANEHYSYMSLWCLMASPLIYSGDMGHLDEFTLNVLCNPEVIDIDQDPLGAQGYPAIQEEDQEIWRKDLEDGSLAVGLFNTGEVANMLAVEWAELGLSGPQAVRDLWRQKDLGVFEKEFSAPVERHGVVLLRVRSTGK